MNSQLSTFGGASRNGVANATRENYGVYGPAQSCSIALPPPATCGCTPAAFSQLGNGQAYAFISNGYGSVVGCRRF